MQTRLLKLASPGKQLPRCASRSILFRTMKAMAPVQGLEFQYCKMNENLNPQLALGVIAVCIKHMCRVLLAAQVAASCSAAHRGLSRHWLCGIGRMPCPSSRWNPLASSSAARRFWRPGLGSTRSRNAGFSSSTSDSGLLCRRRRHLGMFFIFVFYFDDIRVRAWVFLRWRKWVEARRSRALNPDDDERWSPETILSTGLGWILRGMFFSP
jgi:hypothetical protein